MDGFLGGICSDFSDFCFFFSDYFLFFAGDVLFFFSRILKGFVWECSWKMSMEISMEFSWDSNSFDFLIGIRDLVSLSWSMSCEKDFNGHSWDF